MCDKRSIECIVTRPNDLAAHADVAAHQSVDERWKIVVAGPRPTGAWATGTIPKLCAAPSLRRRYNPQENSPPSMHDAGHIGDQPETMITIGPERLITFTGICTARPAARKGR
jgi:hypothetical protein